jgi:predicted RNA-binding Zn-ribbon protein involved in translation (DUF1610 family)
MTIAQAIEALKKMPQDSRVYFDCPNCGRANEMVLCTQAVVVKTERAKP